MRVVDIRIGSHEKSCKVEADILIGANREPFTLWYTLPSELRELINIQDASFLVPALLLPAMKLGESLEIDTAISLRLSHSIERIQAIYQCWDTKLARISIIAPTAEHPTPTASEVGLFFSGGVDSSYSLTRNTISHPLNEDTITQLVVIHGFDIRLGDDKAHVFEQKLRNTRMLGERLGKGVISVANNLQDLTEQLQIQWGGLAHGAALASVGLLMANRFRKLYIAPNWSYARILPSGAHPLLDPLWSTESLTFFHDGCEASRLGRMRLIAQHPVTLDALHVCWGFGNSEFNCGRCSKCVGLMVGLHICGALGLCPTLPKTLDLAVLRNVSLVMAAEIEWWQELIDALTFSNSDAEIREALLGPLTAARTHFDRLDTLKRSINALIPPRHQFILVDNEHIREKLGGGIPFLERDGQFYGVPADDGVAITELERLHKSGSTFVVFWWTCFWWLDSYPVLNNYLRSNYRCMIENESVKIFDLRVASGGAYSDLLSMKQGPEREQ